MSRILPEKILKKCTERARTAFAYALTHGNKKPEPLDLIYAIARERGSLGANLLLAHNITLPTVRQSWHSAPSSNSPARTRQPKERTPSDTLKNVAKRAVKLASEHESRHVGTEHLVAALLEESSVQKFLAKKVPAQSLDTLKNQVAALLPHTAQMPNLASLIEPISELEAQKDRSRPHRSTAPKKESQGKSRTKKTSENVRALDYFCEDLVVAAANSRLDPLVGREREVERMISILSRRTKNNPVLIGEAGVGKTALVHGLANLIHKKTLPAHLADRRLLALDLGLLIAGTVFRGEFEGRLKDVIREAEEEGALLFIDEIHTVVGAGAAQGSLDAANILKPAIVRGQFQVIGATTTEEYRKTIEKDPALERRFQPIAIREPSAGETLRILEGLRSGFEEYHNVQIGDEVLEKAVLLSERFLGSRAFPDKAIDVIDEAAAALRSQISNRTKTALTESHVERAVSHIAGVSLERISKPERAKLLELEDRLSRRIVGQNHVIAALASSLRRARSGVTDSRRPMGSFLFVGPSGVGKTELAKVLADIFFEDNGAFYKIDMSEFSEGHALSKLLGAPAGYVGYDDGSTLVEYVRRHPYALILFDEIEKAHPNVQNTLLQILEDGELTDSRGVRASFRHTLIILTANIGSSAHAKTSGGIGFGTASARTSSDETAHEFLTRALRPELVSRLDQTLVFRSLNEQDIARIVEIEIASLQVRMKEQGIAFTCSPSAIKHIARQSQKSSHGGRHVRAQVQRLVEEPLAHRIIAGEFDTKKRATLSAAKGTLTWRLSKR